MIIVAYLVLLALPAFAAGGPQVAYTKNFPGSIPPYVCVTVDTDGTAVYNETKDPDDDEKIHIEASRTKQIFELADQLGHFNRTLESGLKVANLGQKTFRWEEGTERHEATFNYSTSEEARSLTAHFESIVESVRLLVEFRRVIKHDRLGANSAVNRAAVLWDKKRLAATGDFLPLLDQVAGNEVYIHMARQKAAELAEAIRAAEK